jgi:anti-sigma factor RsiW
VNCEELLDLLLDYIGGELVVEQHRTIEVHLAGCARCVMLIESYRYTIRLARALPKCERLPAAVEARLRKVLAPHFGGEGESEKKG